MSESEISATGLWDHSKGWWDEPMLELLSGTKEEAVRLRTMLGEVERTGNKNLGSVAPYFVDRYGLSRGTRLFATHYDSSNVTDLNIHAFIGQRTRLTYTFHFL